jgi:hypothetical protein
LTFVLPSSSWVLVDFALPLPMTPRLFVVTE